MIILNRILHIEDEGADGAGLELRCLAGEADQEHLEELWYGFEAGQDLCHTQESFLSPQSHLLIRVVDG